MIAHISLFLIFQALALWLASLKFRDSSLMDRFWGSSFVCVVAILYFSSDPKLGHELLFIMVLIWGLRLSLYVTMRNWGKGEDHRYLAMRQSIPNYPVKSLFIVFLFQGALVAVIAIPLIFYFIQDKGHPLSGTSILGISVWCLGLVTEIVSDQQMKSFKKRSSSKEQIMDQGLWAFSRHPNYVGEALIWWGLWIYTLPSWSFLSIISPIMMTWLLRYFTGVEHLERHMVKSRPAYQDYQKKVPVFWPNFGALKKNEL